MDSSQLATMMLEWEETQRKSDELKARIEAEVLAIGKTQTVGNVRATYIAGQKIYDYEEAWRAHGYGTGVDIEKFQKVKVTYDYCAACNAAELIEEDIPCTQSLPSVTIKLLA